MKKSLFICVILFGIIASVKSSPICSTFQKADVDPEKEIELMGSLCDENVRALIITPIDATINNTSLNALFLNNLGTINVVIYSDSGNTVYDENVDTSNSSVLTIDVSNWDSGSYQIYFANTSGQCISGSFVIE